MKKRILSLLVALCLIVGLLPVIAMADTYSAEVTFLSGTYTLSTASADDSVVCLGVTTSDTAVSTVNVLADDASDYNVKLVILETGNVEIYLNGVTAQTGASTPRSILRIGSTTVTNNNFDARIIIEDDSAFYLQAAGVNTAYTGSIVSLLNGDHTTTITSNKKADNTLAKLDITSGSKNRVRAIHSANDVVLYNANIDARMGNSTSTSCATLSIEGDLTIDGGSLYASHTKSVAVIYLGGSDHSDSAKNLSDGTGDCNLTIQNGAKVEVVGTYHTSNQFPKPLIVDGELIIDNSDVTISYDRGSGNCVLSKTGGVEKGSSLADLRNVTLQVGIDSNGTDAFDYELSYGYAVPNVDNIEGSETKGSYYKYFHTTPVGGGSGEGEEDEITISAAMDLGADLSYVAFVDPADVEGKDDLKAKITHTYADGRAADVQESALTYGQVQGENWYYASYEKLAAKEMMDELHIEIYAGEEKIAEDTQTVRSYIERTVGTVDVDWQKAFAAILNYGAGAQALFTYNTGNPANGNLTGTLASVDLSGVTVPTGAYTVSGDYNGMRLAWENSIAAVMFVDGIVEGMTAKFTVGGQDYDPVEILDGGVNGTGFKCGNVAYKDLEADIVLTVYDAQDMPVATYTDSMASYITRNPSVTGINAFAVMCVCVAAAQ